MEWLDRVMQVLTPPECSQDYRLTISGTAGSQNLFTRVRGVACWPRLSFQPFESGATRNYTYSPKTIAALTEQQPVGSYLIFVRIAESKRSRPQNAMSPIFRIVE